VPLDYPDKPGGELPEKLTQAHDGLACSANIRATDTALSRRRLGDHAVTEMLRINSGPAS